MLGTEPECEEVPPADRGRRRRRRWVWAVAAVLALAAAGAGAWRAGLVAHRPQRQISDGVQLVRPEFASEKPPPPPPPLRVSGKGRQALLARAANNAARELAGSGDNSRVSWTPKVGLWARMFVPADVSSNWRAPIWWQSAIALDMMVRYLTVAHDTQPEFEALIQRTWQMGIRMPHTHSPRNFANMFMDDTAWWALAWLDTSHYELAIRHNVRLARRDERLAATDAAFIYNRPRPCRTQGIEWQADYPPDTITNAEFVALAAQLARIQRAPGPLSDPAQGRMWLGRAKTILGWLESSGLVHLSAGIVRDRYNGRCRPTGGPLTYTQGEMAEALTQLGLATGDVRYFNQATRFIDRVLSPSFGVWKDGVLREWCEAGKRLCGGEPHAYDAEAYKGLFVQGVSDWTQATGSRAYDGFLSAQAQAVLANASSDGKSLTPCTRSAHDCQLGFYWARRLPPSRQPILATAGSQESGLAALTAALEVADSTASRCSPRAGALACAGTRAVPATGTADPPRHVPASTRRHTPDRLPLAAHLPGG